MDVKKDILWRVYLCFLGMTVLGVAIIGKAFYIQQVQGEYWKGLSEKLHLEYRELDADRGTIYSEDGSMLSTSIPYFDIHIDFGAEGLREKNGKRFHENLDSLSQGLARLFPDKKAADYKRMLKAGYASRDRYYLLRKNISFRQYQELRQLPLVRQGRNKSGFVIEDREKRLTPFQLLANRTIGLSREFINSEGRVVSKNVGLEKSYDSVLRGVTGKRLVRRIAGGAFVPIEGSEIEPENGKDVITTLDVNIQDITETALMRMMVENEALEGTAVVMEVATGKIKAIANLARQPDGSYFESDNFAVRTSEPGSTIKLITLLTALEDRIVDINDKIEINGGVWMLNGRRIVDDHKSSHDYVTFKEAFAQSSNVAMAKLAYQYYINKPKEYIKHFRNLKLTGKTGIDLQEEFFPLVKNPEKKSWHYQTLASMGFGYEVMLSPLQLLMVYNAVANEGKLMKPYLVNRIEKDGQVLHEFAPTVLNEKICSEQTLRQLKECLEAVCTEGTGRTIFQGAPYLAAGKTGTAKVNDGKFKYADGVYQAAFAGYFPARDPVYSCIVVIKNKPRAARYYGGAVAAPVFREIADKLYSSHMRDRERKPVILADSSMALYAGLSRDIRQVYGGLQWPLQGEIADGGWSMVRTREGRSEAEQLELPDQVMPSVRGMGLKDALFLLENKGLTVRVKGRGKVVSQSIEAGKPYKSGQPVWLMLE